MVRMRVQGWRSVFRACDGNGSSSVRRVNPFFPLDQRGLASRNMTAVRCTDPAGLGYISRSLRGVVAPATPLDDPERDRDPKRHGVAPSPPHYRTIEAQSRGLQTPWIRASQPGSPRYHAILGSGWWLTFFG